MVASRGLPLMFLLVLLAHQVRAECRIACCLAGDPIAGQCAGGASFHEPCGKSETACQSCGGVYCPFGGCNCSDDASADAVARHALDSTDYNYEDVPCPSPEEGDEIGDGDGESGAICCFDSIYDDLVCPTCTAKAIGSEWCALSRSNCEGPCNGKYCTREEIEEEFESRVGTCCFYSPSSTDFCGKCEAAETGFEYCALSKENCEERCNGTFCPLESPDTTDDEDGDELEMTPEPTDDAAEDDIEASAEPADDEEEDDEEASAEPTEDVEGDDAEASVEPTDEEEEDDIEASAEPTEDEEEDDVEASAEPTDDGEDDDMEASAEPADDEEEDDIEASAEPTEDGADDLVGDLQRGTCCVFGTLEEDVCGSCISFADDERCLESRSSCESICNGAFCPQDGSSTQEPGDNDDDSDDPCDDDTEPSLVRPAAAVSSHVANAGRIFKNADGPITLTFGEEAE